MTAPEVTATAEAVKAELAFEHETREDLRARRWLRLHALLLGGLTLGLCAAISAGLLRLGLESLLWRPLAALLLTYPLYLGLMGLWARLLLGREASAPEVPVRASDAVAEASADATGGLIDALARGTVRVAPPLSGGGGDFAGGGASAAFEMPGATGSTHSALADAVNGVAGAVGDAVGGVADAVGSAVGKVTDVGSDSDDSDAGAVVVPLLVVIGVTVALAAALGFAVFGLFGVDTLLGASVEVAFGSMGGALAWRARREGWLAHTLRRTAWPMLGLLGCVAVAGWLLQTWVPQAQTWPQALRVVFG